MALILAKKKKKGTFLLFQLLKIWQCLFIFRLLDTHRFIVSNAISVPSVWKTGNVHTTPFFSFPGAAQYHQRLWVGKQGSEARYNYTLLLKKQFLIVIKSFCDFSGWVIPAWLHVSYFKKKKLSRPHSCFAWVPRFFSSRGLEQGLSYYCFALANDMWMFCASFFKGCPLKCMKKRKTSGGKGFKKLSLIFKNPSSNDQTRNVGCVTVAFPNMDILKGVDFTSWSFPGFCKELWTYFLHIRKEWVKLYLA